MGRFDNFRSICTVVSLICACVASFILVFGKWKLSLADVCYSIGLSDYFDLMYSYAKHYLIAATILVIVAFILMIAIIITFILEKIDI